MSLAKLIVHLFVPHESNNQKAKILHPSGLTVLALFLLLFQSVIHITPKVFPRVLGYAANISPSEVIRLTNEKRAQAGLGPLAENGTLSAAAQAKGAHMLANGYWAHFAPDGTSPWKFFNDFGYKYKYAGENLARDFSNPSAAVDAWMASPTHKENILNPNYKEVGIGVVEGSLSGTDTTIIVQFFGAKAGSGGAIPVAKAQTTNTQTATAKPAAPKATSEPTVAPTATPAPTQTPTPTSAGSVGSQQDDKKGWLVSPFTTTKGISLATVGIILLVLSIDLIVVRRRRIMRIGGRTLAHIAFFGMILAVILILKAGQII
ncbi:MAG: CAP domain-containing protein [Microgenomates group bacterium]